MTKKEVRYYVADNGNSPFENWLKKLDINTKVVLIRYIQRLANGGLSKSIKALKDGVFEIKIKYGPGYRIYFAEEKNTIIILLLGGNKKTQDRDIKMSKTYWRNYGK